MAVPLTMVERVGSVQTDWERFLRQRESVTATMHLAVCDGCDQCGGRCTDGFDVTREEWEQVRDYLATLPADEVERVLTQNKTVPWPGAEETGATVTMCRFRDMESGNCFVYPARPTICRLFGQTHWLPCPIGAVPAYPESAPELWNRYRGFARRSLADWLADEEGEIDTVRPALLP